jgi:putative ABC transport system permease protein
MKVYMPASWSPQTVTSFVVDLKAEPNGKTETNLRKEIYRFDSRIVCYAADRLAEAPRRQLSSEHLAFSVLQVLSAIAIILTVVGLFSILAYTVDRRMGEFGIRMALGATQANLVSLVLCRGLALTAIGLAAGVGGAIGLTRFMQSILYETESYDPAVIAGVAGLLVLSALAACLLPALRASRPNLAELLKSDH